MIQDLFLDLPSRRKHEILGVEEGMFFAFEETVAVPVNGNQMCLNLGFPAGLLFILKPSSNSGMSCPFLWGRCGRLVFSGGEHLVDVNINLIGQHFQVNLGKLRTSPLKLLN